MLQKKECINEDMGRLLIYWRVQARCFISKVNDPWMNLAFEERLFREPVESGAEFNLLLWRNSPCVVIGRNQVGATGSCGAVPLQN